MQKREEILKELKKISLTTNNIIKKLEEEQLYKIVKNQKEFDEAVLKLAQDRAKTDNYKTVNGVKRRIMQGKIIPKAGKEAEEIVKNYGIPIDAWSDMEYYKKTLLP